jgi:hypothetical protein
MCSEMLSVQAYTVELEAELNHLKEENACPKAEEAGTDKPRHDLIHQDFPIISLSYLCIDLTLSL